MGVADAAKTKLAEKQGGNGKENLPARSGMKTLTGLKANQIAELFGAYKLQIAQAVPKHLTAERMIQLATTVVSRNTDLKSCTPASVIGAVMNAAMLGLDITPQFGQAYFVPYNNSKAGVKECQFMVGYRGWIQLFRRSNEISTIYAEVVREGDEFSVEYGLNMTLVHKPNLAKRGKLIAVYAVVKYKDGGYNFSVLTEADVLARKARSRAASKGGPWETDPEAMWRKSAIRSLIPYVPASVEMLKATMTDGAVITTEMFSPETKDVDLDKVEEAQAEVVEEEQGGDEFENQQEAQPQPEANAETKEQPAAEQNELAGIVDTKTEFLSAAAPAMRAILKAKGGEYFAGLIGKLGYKNLEEVKPASWNAVLDMLVNEADKLAN